MKSSKYTTLIVALTAAFACISTAADKEKPDWVNLLEGDSLAQWKVGPSKAKVKRTEIGNLWSVKDGVLHLDKEREGRGGHIVTKNSYYDFELHFEFRISHNGNSGVKYRTNDGIGLEFQILDDVNHRDNKKANHRTASIYDLVAAPETKRLNPKGEWNQARIVAKGNTLEHWLNGEMAVRLVFGSDDWKERYSESKYTKYPDFARNPGPILLQDHGDTVSFRNLRIRELK